eukprot:gene9801-biopygen13801
MVPVDGRGRVGYGGVRNRCEPNRTRPDQTKPNQTKHDQTKAHENKQNDGVPCAVLWVRGTHQCVFTVATGCGVFYRWLSAVGAANGAVTADTEGLFQLLTSAPGHELLFAPTPRLPELRGWRCDFS